MHSTAVGVLAWLQLSARTPTTTQGVPVVLDAGGVDAPLSSDLLAQLTVFSPNETELARITGLPTESETEVVGAAETLLDLGLGQVLVKRGSQGSMLVQRSGGKTVSRGGAAVAVARVGRCTRVGRGTLLLCTG